MAFVSLEDVCAYLQTQLAANADMRGAPATIADNANIWPFGVTICRRADASIGEPAGQILFEATFATQIHVARRDSSRDFASAMPLLIPYIRSIAADVTMGSRVSTLTGKILARFAAMKYAGQDTVGWDIEIPTKITVS